MKDTNKNEMLGCENRKARLRISKIHEWWHHRLTRTQKVQHNKTCHGLLSFSNRSANRENTYSYPHDSAMGYYLTLLPWKCSISTFASDVWQELYSNTGHAQYLNEFLRFSQPSKLLPLPLHILYYVIELRNHASNDVFVHLQRQLALCKYFGGRTHSFFAFLGA